VEKMLTGKQKMHVIVRPKKDKTSKMVSLTVKNISSSARHKLDEFTGIFQRVLVL